MNGTLLTWLIVSFLLLVTAAVAVERDWFDGRDGFQVATVPAEMLQKTATGKLFARLGLLGVVPNNEKRYRPTESSILDLGTGIFPRRRQVGLHLYSVRQVSPQRLPSSLAIERQEVERGLPIISLLMLPRDLYDEKRGLHQNILEKGRVGERQGFVSFFNENKLLFASAVGVRLHGGVARHAPLKSYRLLFRDEYGTDRFPSGVLFSRHIEPLSSFVLDAHKHDATQLVDPIALDVARMVGAIAPEVRPVRMFLNGIDRGVYFAMEHVSRRYLRAHYGHDNFTMVRSKHYEKVIGEGADYWQFNLWVKRSDFDMEQISMKIDIENFARWVISNLLCLTVDHDQGPVLRDDSSAGDGRWFYINWDMDASFGVSGHLGERPWESDVVLVFGLGTIRQTILTRLHKDPNWRRYFVTLFANILNHEFTPDRVQGLIDRYDSIVTRFSMGPEGRNVMALIRKVLENRPPVMHGWLDKHYQAGKIHRVIVRAPARMKIVVDGYERQGPYSGNYFSVTPFSLNTSDERITAWIVNGEHYPGPELALASVEEDLDIIPATDGSGK